jgi:hypothetical protein
MTKLSQMTSHMSFMTNGWNVPHHVLNDYCLKQFVCNDFKAIILFVFYDWNINHKLNHIIENFF